nr:CD209 antigen-like protein E [Paramormyrops kingsleyae]
MEMKYARADEGTENLISNADIKEAGNTETDTHMMRPGPQFSGTRCYRLAAVCLGMLCLLLLLIITVISVYYKGAFNDFEETFSMLAAKRDQLQGNYSSLKTNYNQLQTNYSIVKTERDQLASAAQRPRCPSGWISFNFKCYYVSDRQKTWIDSREDCKHKGADLIIINSLKEQLIFSKDQIAWIGLTDSGHEGTWKWVDGSPLTTSYWMTGEPNNVGGNEDCAEIITHKEALKNWNDGHCNQLKNWICEQGEVN